MLVTIVVVAIGFFGGWTKTDGGTVAVIRNGGWFDDNNVRQVVQPSSGLTWVGFWSNEHDYPASQRYFKISGSQTADSNETINVPTRDGVTVGIEGTFYFYLNTDPTVLKNFDNAYGTRTFPVAGGKSLHAWDGDDGWSAFLNATLDNLVQNVLRQEIGNVNCSDLVASCALAQNNSGATQPASPSTSGGPASNDTIQKVEAAANAGFAQDLQNVLGGPYLTRIAFSLSKVDLPANVLSAINDAQASFAGVTKAEAALKQAQIDAQANEARQQGYSACPACAQIDVMKAIPSNVTVYAPGAGAAVPLVAPAK